MILSLLLSKILPKKKKRNRRTSTMAVPMTKKTTRRYDPAGGRIFAVGDIHGEYDKLVEMVGLIESYERASNDKVIFLGDYVDKGPDSCKVVDFLINYQKEDPENVIILMGNHDYHFATFSKKWATKDFSKPTIESYRRTNWNKRSLVEEYWYPIDTLKIKEHRAFLKGLPQSYKTDKSNFFFCHAGIDPDKETWEQDPKTLMFIREKFTKAAEIDSGYKYIVHGHHKLENGKVDIRHNRINVDTACFATGVLSCVVLDDNTGEVVEVLQTKAGK